MPSANTTTTTNGGNSLNPNSNLAISCKLSPIQKFETLDQQTSASSPMAPIHIDGFSHDEVLSKSEVLTRPEVMNRRARRVRLLARIYRDQYWALMEELKGKYREYYWEYGKSPFAEDEENAGNNGENCTVVTGENAGNNGTLGGHNCIQSGNLANTCGIHGCKAKAMALTKFCHMHILSDSKQKLYKACNFSIKSSTIGPILCGKPILRSTVPSYCYLHFQKAEKHMARALKKAGFNSASKPAPKFHVTVSEYVRQIKKKRIAIQRGNAVVKEEIYS